MTKSWILSWAGPPVRGRGSARLDLGKPALHPKSCAGQIFLPSLSVSYTHLETDKYEAILAYMDAELTPQTRKVLDLRFRQKLK